MEQESREFFDWTKGIERSDLAAIDKLKTFFGQITSEIIKDAEREIELAKAIQDGESLVKQQIKMETTRTARDIFAQGYYVATGRRIWRA